MFEIVVMEPQLQVTNSGFIQLPFLGRESNQRERVNREKVIGLVSPLKQYSTFHTLKVKQNELKDRLWYFNYWNEEVTQFYTFEKDQESIVEAYDGNNNEVSVFSTIRM